MQKIKTCSVEGCGSAYRVVQGLCSTHYQRKRLKGDVHAVSDHLSRTEEERFWQKVRKTENCWEWLGAVEATGYGRFYTKNRFWLAHRYSYEKFRGSIPEGHVIDHKCNNRKCVNPDHLETATYSQNSDNFRGVKKSNTSGHRNVSWAKNLDKWLVTATTNGKRKHLGVYPLYELHRAAYYARAYRLTQKGLKE